MKKVLLAALVGILSLGAGLVGTYFALPVVAPNAVEQAAPPDSAAAPSPSDPAPSTKTNPAVPTESASPTTRPDSTTVSSADSSRSDSTAVPQPDQQLASFEAVHMLRDSLRMMRDSVNTLADKSQTLEGDLQKLRSQLQSLQATRTKAADIAKTLTKLEDEELEAVLSKLDMQTYEILYTEATGRNRTRLLRALPPQEAARLVNRMIVSEN